MKITFLTLGGSQIGGISKYNQSLLLVLKEIVPKISVIRLQPGSSVKKFFFTLKTILNLFFFKPDFVFCTHINFSPVCLLLKRTFKTEFVVFTYGTDVWDIRSNYLKKALKKAKMIVTISQFTMKKLVDQIPEIESRIFILPPVVDGNEFYPQKKPNYLLERHGFKNSDKIILTIARLSAEEQMKGYDKVIMGLPKVIETVPEIKYLLIGDGTDVPRIKKLIKELKLEDYVIMLGSIPQNPPLLVDYYNLCDIYVMPSVSEGFGIVFIEALACGKPVIAGNLDASPETLLHGKLGFLVNPNDKDEISEAIIKVLRKKVPAYLLDGEYLRNKTLETYGPEKFREGVRALLNADFL